MGLAVDVGAASFDEVLGWEGDFVLREGVEKAFETAATCAVFRATNVSDAFAFDGEKMFRGEFAGGVVVGTDEVRWEVIEVAIQEDERRGSEACCGKQIRFHLAGSDDESVETMREHLLDLLHLEERIFFRGGYDEEVALFAKDLGETFGNVREERVHEVRNDEPDEKGAAGDKAACGEVRAVAEFFDAFFHSLAGFQADIRMVAQSLGYSDQRHTEIPSNVLHFDGHMRTIHSPEGSFEGDPGGEAREVMDRFDKS
jgi:hypothetical protein